MTGPFFPTFADRRAWTERGSGLYAHRYECADHNRRWLAVFLSRPWDPSWGPKIRRLVIEVDATADAEGNAIFDGPARFPLGRPPAFDLDLPCGHPSGHRVAPHIETTWFDS